MSQPAPAEPEGFLLQDPNGNDSDIFIPYADCVCEYDSGDFQIYTKYLAYGNEYFPHFYGTVIYLKAQENSIQMVTPAEYCIDYENGILYYIGRENDTFVSIYRYCADSSGERAEVGGAKVLSFYTVEEWLAGSCQLPLNDSDDTFSDRKLIVTALETDEENSILKGEASGIHKSTGKYCHVDWELNYMTGEETVTPHEKKIYEEETDKEIFAACAEAFDKMEKEDWSPLRYKKNFYLYSGRKWNWLRMDVNGDGLPELIEVSKHMGDFIFPIEYIFTYTGGILQPVELVYTDLNDYTEFIYLGSNGNLIYDCVNITQEIYGCFDWYQFDESWDKKIAARLEVYYFDESSYDEEERKCAAEFYSDTFGSRGAGFYCFISRPKSAEELINVWDVESMVRKEITLEEFLEEYKQMTGFDFFTVQEDFAPYQ